MNALSEKILNASVCLFTINNFLRVPQSGSVFLKLAAVMNPLPCQSINVPAGTRYRRSVLTLLHRSNKIRTFFSVKIGSCRTFSEPLSGFLTEIISGPVTFIVVAGEDA